MYKPSLTLILSGLFLAYILHSIWSLAQLFIPPKCDPQSSKLCFRSFLTTNPNLHLLLYTSAENKPRQNQVNLIHNLTSFDFQQPFEQYVTLNIPSKTLNNGSLFLHVIVIGHGNKYISKKEYGWKEINAIHEANSIIIPLTQYAKPQLQTFKLLEEQKKQIKSNVNFKPVTHLRTKVTFGIFEDLISLPADQLPIELMKLIIVTPKGEYLPIIKYDFLQTRLCDLSLLTSQNKTVNITISYTPIGIGKLRLLVQLEAALESLLKLGFTEKDIDEVKGVFADINIYLLYVTVFVGSVHLLFDFLSFKNDVAFWRNKKSLVGLSVRTVLWRTFSQAVVFLYLLDEKTSLLVLIPCGIATLIEFWKATKIFNLNVIMSSGLPRISFKLKGTSDEEKKTQMYDAECMQYLSYVLYPLCIAGAIYSLIYEPHKSWYSWTIHSTVNGVYAFGFLFMLPQLFVNYRLKSVAALPWRAFTYKAFNTFIDDLFAFIITMPTAHRVACFRDDVVFLIYLYQRWLYPVDSTRMDDPDVRNDEDNMINEKKNIKNEILIEDLKNKASQQIYDKKKKN